MSIETAVILATLLTNLIGFGYTWFRDGRAHRWQIEKLDRNNDSIASGTSAAKNAYKEANDVNLKIRDIMQEIKEINSKVALLFRRHDEPRTRRTDSPRPNNGRKRTRNKRVH